MISELIHSWDEQGYLKAIKQEFSDLASGLCVPAEVNNHRKLTADQIRDCFDPMFSAFVLAAIDIGIDQPPISIDDMIHAFRRRMADDDFVEILFEVAHNNIVSDQEVLGDLLRDIDNTIWQREVE